MAMAAHLSPVCGSCSVLGQLHARAFVTHCFSCFPSSLQRVPVVGFAGCSFGSTGADPITGSGRATRDTVSPAGFCAAYFSISIFPASCPSLAVVPQGRPQITFDGRCGKYDKLIECGVRV